MKEYIHIWDFPYETSVSINRNFLNLLKDKIKNKYQKFKSVQKLIDCKISFSYFKAILSSNCKYFRNLKIFIGLCNLLEIPLEELEKNVLAYRTTRGRCTIENPILPIEINPIFDMLIAHIFGDGNSVQIDGRELYFNYRQFDEEHLHLFIKKVESVFGRIKYENEYFYSLNRVYLPTIISSILANYYSFESEDFLSTKCFVPHKLFTHSKDHLLAFLIGIVIDEGFVDSGQIVIALHNKRLINDLGKICEMLGYSYTISEDKKIPIKSIIYILEDGVRKFWEDYLTLKKKYPEVYLGYKENQIRDFILRKQKFWRTQSQGVTKNLIIKLLREKSRNIRELAKILLISRQGIRHHIKQLERMGVVKKIGKGKMGSDIYTLVKFTQIPIIKKGRSRQYGITAEKIAQLLMEFGSLDTKEISKKLRMGRSSIFHTLKKLEKEKKIVPIGKRVYTTHPTVVWALC